MFEFFSKAENLPQLIPAVAPLSHFGRRPFAAAQKRGDRLIRCSLRWRIFPIDRPIDRTTGIIECNRPYRLVDLETKGPCQRRHHEHRFAAEGNGTWITDEVQYKLPFGFFCTIAHTPKVNDGKTIFACRTEAVDRLWAGNA